jgi:hypothetical protein
MKSGVKRLWSGLTWAFVLQREEYRASLQALNIFFGAIIGVAFGRIEQMPVLDYIMLLFLTAAIVSFILVVSNTRRRFYSAIALSLIMGASWFLLYEKPIFAETPRLLFPTLLVWSMMALLTEFSPREREARDK